MIIYRSTDRVKVEIDGINFKISPLTFQQKQELQGHMIKAVSGDMNEAMISVSKSLKYCLKDMSGVFYIDEDGQKREYKLSFEDGVLTDDCIDELLNMPFSSKLNSVCSAMLQGVPEKILDADGNEIEGIKIKQHQGDEELGK
tara:strand:- start:6447 stop:6875 length:429 start_codon:yes stop_codon:yes gene_type:complete